jgi:hypothetical protein
MEKDEGQVIYDPGTYIPATKTCQPFPNNTIPNAYISQQALRILS